MIVVFTYFYTAVQFNPVDQADNLRKYGGYIPGIRPGPADRAVPRPRALAADAARLALPRARRRPPEPLHRVRRVLAGERRRARRHLGADRGRRRARHDAPDGVADDDAVVRGLPQVAGEAPRDDACESSSWARRGPARALRRSGSPPPTTPRTSRRETSCARPSPTAPSSVGRCARSSSAATSCPTSSWSTSSASASRTRTGSCSTASRAPWRRPKRSTRCSRRSASRSTR